MVFYWEIVEAVRPKGTPTAAIGWLWTFEGTALAIGAALSGYISEAFSPRYCLAAMSVCVLIGYLIISNGHVLLKSADRLPTQSEDEEAMNIALDMMGGDYAPLEAVKGISLFLFITNKNKLIRTTLMNHNIRIPPKIQKNFFTKIPVCATTKAIQKL